MSSVQSCEAVVDGSKRPAGSRVDEALSFIGQVEVVEPSFADIECLASFESSDGVYARLLECLRSEADRNCVFPVLTKR